MGAKLATGSVLSLLEKETEREETREREKLEARREREEIKRNAAIKKAKMINRNYSSGISGKMNDNLLTNLDKEKQFELDNVKKPTNFSRNRFFDFARLI